MRLIFCIEIFITIKVTYVLEASDLWELHVDPQHEHSDACVPRDEPPQERHREEEGGPQCRRYQVKNTVKMS